MDNNLQAPTQMVFHGPPHIAKMGSPATLEGDASGRDESIQENLTREEAMLKRKVALLETFLENGGLPLPREI